MLLFDNLIEKIISTFILSMVPVIELRAAIPIATANGLSPWIAIPVAVAGNLVPVPFIILFTRKIFAWLRQHLASQSRFLNRLENHAAKKKDIVLRYAFWGLVILVAIPLPGTGAWTGALVAALLNMRLKKAFPAIAMGVLFAGIVVAFVSYGAASLFF